MKLFLTAILLGAPLLQDSEPRPALDEYNLGKGRLALAGYDPVAYFDVGGGKPTKGKKTRNNKATDKLIVRRRRK